MEYFVPIIIGLGVVIYILIQIFKSKHDSTDTPTIDPVVDTDDETTTTNDTGGTTQVPIKKALLVGINNYDPSVGAAGLEGCINDVKNMQGLLTGHYGFSTGNIKMLTDSQATTKGILDGLVWLLSNNTMGSELVFHYSGHGSQIPDLNGDEPDGLDEIICPYDLDWNNPISDDVLARLFKQLPAGIYLTMISDSCHSGTVDRDLRMNHRQKFVNMPNDMQGKLKGKKLSIKNHFGKKDTGVQGHILVSGCRDNQTSEDAYINGIHQGAFTWALTSSIKANLNSTWTEAYKATLTAMATAGVTSQTPQLSGNADLEARHVFGGVV